MAVLASSSFDYLTRGRYLDTEISTLGSPARTYKVYLITEGPITGIDWWVLPCQEDRMFGRTSTVPTQVSAVPLQVLVLPPQVSAVRLAKRLLHIRVLEMLD